MIIFLFSMLFYNVTLNGDPTTFMERLVQTSGVRFGLCFQAV